MHPSLSSHQSKWYFHSSCDSGADNSTPSCSNLDLPGHTLSTALSVAFFDEGVFAPCTPETLISIESISIFSISMFQEGTATASIDDYSSDEEVQIVPNGDGTIPKSSTSIY